MWKFSSELSHFSTFAIWRFAFLRVKWIDFLKLSEVQKSTRNFWLVLLKQYLKEQQIFCIFILFWSDSRLEKLTVCLIVVSACSIRSIRAKVVHGTYPFWKVLDYAVLICIFILFFIVLGLFFTMYIVQNLISHYQICFYCIAKSCFVLFLSILLGQILRRLVKMYNWTIARP